MHDLAKVKSTKCQLNRDSKTDLQVCFKASLSLYSISSDTQSKLNFAVKANTSSYKQSTLK